MVKAVTQDKRVASTRAAAREALVSLIAEKGLGNFSVTELCQTAGLNRGTFYNHWKSIDQLLSECEDELMAGLEECIREFPKLNGDMLCECVNENKPISGIVDVFSYIKGQSKFMEVVSGFNGDGHFVLKLRRSLSSNFLKYIIRDRYDCATETDAEYFAWFHASAFLGIVQYWVLRQCPESPEEMALKLVHLLYFQPSDHLIAI